MTTASVSTSLPAVGEPAPDFRLRSTAETDVALSAFRGRKNVLLAFFPLAFTSTCTREMSAFSDDIIQFESRDTVVLPISVDSTATLKEFRARWKLPFDLLSDFRRDVSRAYGVLNEAKFYANRAYILVDRSGVVRWAWQEQENGQRRENSELLARITELG